MKPLAPILAHDQPAQEAVDVAIVSAFDEWAGADGASLQRAAQDHALPQGKKASSLMAPYVGERYTLVRDGRPFRLVIVSMDAGSAKHVDFAERRRRFREIASWSKVPLGHLQGTLLALQAWLEPWLEADGRRVRLGDDGGSPWQCFALLNAPPVSIIKPGEGRNRSNIPPRLARQSAGLLRRLIEVLQPTVILGQGTNARIALAAAFPDAGIRADRVAYLNSAPVLAASHPSAPSSLAWAYGSRPTPYFRKVVAPFLVEAREAIARDCS